MSDPAGPELLEGHAAFAARATEMISGTRTELSLLSQELDRRIYGTESFVGAVRAFVLKHQNTRLRVLVNNTRAAIAGGSRLIEFGRKMSTFIEFRELSIERRQFIREEYLIADGRLLLYREAPGDLASKYYATAPHLARLKLKDFDVLWNESTTAQELRDMRL